MVPVRYTSPVEEKKGISQLLLCVVVATWIVGVDNLSFWTTFLKGRPGSLGAQLIACAGVFVLLVLLLCLLLRPIAGTRPGRWAIAAVLLVSAGVAHYVDGWGILVDKGLVRNIVETDVREAMELLSWPALADLIVRGVLPALAVVLVPVAGAPARQVARQTLALAGLSVLMSGFLAVTLFGTLATTFRNHRELRLQLVPTNYFKAVHSYFRAERRGPESIEPLARDARRPVQPSRPRVMVLVVGETARAANFSLGGYERDTNRALAGKDIVYFSSVTSCGTDTATSLPCMFSNMGAAGFSVEKARIRENALDVLKRVGIDVTWLDNNSGCKGVCARVDSVQMPVAGDPRLCSGEACQDEILLGPLKEALGGPGQDRLIVLHQMGSHGPSYFKRYPQPGRFSPTCDTNRIQSCDRQALINTYDNSIDYTSEVLAQVIDIAAAQADKLDISVLYISDHGESLGERNVYLHGLPVFMAPAEQTAVPMLAWTSGGASRSLALGAEGLSILAKRPLSHDNLFHSLLGYFEVETAAYLKDLDIFAVARANNAARPPAGS